MFIAVCFMLNVTKLATLRDQKVLATKMISVLFHLGKGEEPQIYTGRVFFSNFELQKP